MHYGTVPLFTPPAAYGIPFSPTTRPLAMARGFTFQSYNGDDFLTAIDRALALFTGDRARLGQARPAGYAGGL